VARAEIAHAANEDLDALIRHLSLPVDTRKRVSQALRPLAQFPLLGPPLTGRWSGFRFLLGPWRWLLLVCVYLEDEGRIVVVTMQDARSAKSTKTRGR
jgi:hypothetical protein